MRSKISVAMNIVGMDALDQWGPRAQIIKTCEEMSELMTQLCKHLNGSPTSLEKIIDEVADVLIMAFQMRLLFGPDPVEERILYKLERTRAALEKMRKALPPDPEL